MKEFKGTKGKWEVKHSESKTAYNVVGTVLGGRYKIARCPYLKSDILCDTLNKLEEREVKANAYLIASAPELLKRLNSLVLSIKAHPDYQTGLNQEFIDLVSLAEEAISQALLTDNE